MNKTKLPTVAIVGRTNVGKSTLFNRLVDSVRAIVLDREGVTRDFLRDTVTWQGRQFQLVDTGGISFQQRLDPITKQVREIAVAWIERADLILFLVDASVELTTEDQQLATLLYPYREKVIVILNKQDKNEAQEGSLLIKARLRFEKFIPISATHGRGMAELLELILSQLPQVSIHQTDEVQCKTTLLGRPNVGKSSLLNKLVRMQRSIVSDEPGTTREAIVERIKFLSADVQIADTAGVRRKRSVTDTLEQCMVSSTMNAVREADIVLLLVDAHEGRIADQEAKLGYYVFEEQKKALVWLFNKQDLVTEESAKELEHSQLEYAPLFKKTPQLAISCLTDKNIGRILPLVQKVWERHSQWLPETALLETCMTAITKKPLFVNQRALRLFDVKQVKSAPITIALTVNEPTWFGESQRKFFENSLRKKFDLLGVPVSFVVRR